jgi:hypothetical protein
LNHPDLAVRAFRDDSSQIQLIFPASGVNCACDDSPNCQTPVHFDGGSYGMKGPDFNHLTVVCDPPVLSSSLDGNPCNSSDREWLAAPWTFDGHNVFGLVHMEFSGICQGLCVGPYNSCRQASLTWSVSLDSGATYVQMPDPLLASLPYTWPEAAGQSLDWPSNILFNPADGHW